MVAYAPVIYDSPADLITALEALETTVSIQVVAYMENGKQKFILIQ